MKTYDNIGIDFICAKGKRVTSIQRVRKSDGKSIANADFEDGRLTRCIYADEVNEEDFLEAAEALLENSTPVTFLETKLA